MKQHWDPDVQKFAYMEEGDSVCRRPYIGWHLGMVQRIALKQNYFEDGNEIKSCLFPIGIQEVVIKFNYIELNCKIVLSKNYVAKSSKLTEKSWIDFLICEIEYQTTFKNIALAEVDLVTSCYSQNAICIPILCAIRRPVWYCLGWGSINTCAYNKSHKATRFEGERRLRARFESLSRHFKRTWSNLYFTKHSFRVKKVKPISTLSWSFSVQNDLES